MNTWNVDFLGITEVNVSWEKIKKWERTQGSLEGLHLSVVYNKLGSKVRVHQFGGVTNISRKNTAHRVINKSCEGNGHGQNMEVMRVHL